MLMTPIDEYAPDGGELVRFSLTSDTPEGATHPAPPSYVQENHIRRLLTNQAAGVAQSAWVGVVFDVPGRLDTAAMAAALKVWTRRHPTLLTWFSVEEDGTNGGTEGGTEGTGNGATRIQRHALAAETVAITPESLGPHDSPAAIRARLVDLFDSGTNPLSWPPLVTGAVLREDSSTVYYAVDHCHSDGLSSLLVFSELRALYEAEVTGVAAELPETGSYVDFCALERERSAAIGADSPEVRRWLEFLAGGPATSFPLPLGTEPGRTYPKISLSMDLLDAAETDAFAKACKALGGGQSAGFLAALGVSGYELAGHASYRGLSVVHTRDERRWMRAQGWFINLVPVEFAVGEPGGEQGGEPGGEPGSAARGFGDILSAAQLAFIEAQKMSGVSPLRVMELIPGVSVQPGAGAVLPMVSFIDLRHAPGSQDWTAAKCDGLAGPGTSTDVPIWINRLWDRTYVKVTYPDTAEARRNVPLFLEHLRAVLREIARTGEYRGEYRGEHRSDRG
ncbi:condensation domain-containing protein [Streptomyces sp. NBC_01429]|uniref:condensation domain-containing protein n=1 Tax=Streptomyces sp. NBC_01429 TaxID=2903862 RepID=UPI002E2A704A|nr:condensation domain-containing protein [Streptomyces sp. NBC_01429]